MTVPRTQPLLKRTRFAVAAGNAPVGAPDMMPVMGRRDAPVIVVCDSPTIAMWRKGSPIDGKELSLWIEYAERYGFGQNDFAFVSPCGPVPDDVQGSEKRLKEYADKFSEALFATLATFADKKLYVYTGKLAGQCLTRKPVKIMKQRGVVREVSTLDAPVLPMLSPNHCLRRPEVMDLFDADFNMFRILRDNSYIPTTIADAAEIATNYEWREDISDILANLPSGISIDTETDNRADIPINERVSSLYWYRPEIVPITVQFSYKEGHAICCPVDADYWHFVSPGTQSRLIGQLKQLCENPAVKKCGHNIKYDYHILRKLGINTKGIFGDTMLYAFFADENMFEKSLAECVRRWVPEMAGYSDAADKTFDKTNMRTVSHEDMLPYAGGDVDATLRLVKRLLPIVRVDPKQWNCCQRIQWPAYKAFMEVVEPQGMCVNTGELRQLYDTLNAAAATSYNELISKVPAAVRRAHADKGLEFTRDAFVRDILFTKEGFGLKPRVFTKSTRSLKDESQRIPSVSTKDHLPYFDDNEWIVKLIRHQKVTKLQSTYVGVEDGHRGPTGFWQYIHDGRIHPNYLLHRTTTGRTASTQPNGQNFPKHDRTAVEAIIKDGIIVKAGQANLAKAYRKIFVPTPGYTFIEVDLSQAELRLVAWMANEPTMLRAYQNGEDIHALTAAMIMGITLEAFKALPKAIKKQKRQEAKAVNFGLIYGMSWKKLITYAKTTYQVEFTEDQAQVIHAKYFKTYSNLRPWHAGMRKFVHDRGFVRAMHGALRHLPNIYSIDELIKGDCERQAINSPIQRFASDIGISAMGRMCRGIDTNLLRPVAFIHDALICEVRTDWVREGAAAVKFFMQSTPFREQFNCNPPLPIMADVSIGDNLAEMVEMEGEHAIEACHPFWYSYEDDGYSSIEEAYAYA